MTNLTVTEDKNSFLSQGNFEHAFRMANMISKSSMVPKAYLNKPQDVLIAMEMGRSLRLSPLAAVQNIAVINGKPALYGDGMLAVCSGHPEFEDIKEHKILDQNKKLVGYECIVKRKGRTEVSNIFTIEDAKTANLWAKAGPWTSYPSRMLQMRARGFALRDSFADALGGVRMVEEVQDYEIDITPRQKTSSNVKEQLKSFLQEIKPEPAQAEDVPDLVVETNEEPVETKQVLVNLDELAVIKDTIKENKIDKKKVEEILKMFNVEHIEHLPSEHSEEFVSILINNK